jgi:hypothetical protein
MEWSASRFSPLISQAYLRINLVTILLILSFSYVPPALACWRGRPAEKDGPVNEKLLEQADIAFIGVVESVGKKVHYRVLFPIKGIKDTSYSFTNEFCPAHYPEYGDVLLHVHIPQQPPTPAPDVPGTGGIVMTESADGKGLTSRPMTPAENRTLRDAMSRPPLQEERYFLLRDACQEVRSPRMVASIKEKYEFDLSGVEGLDISQLKLGAEKDDVPAQNALSKYYRCRGDEAESLKWSSRAIFVDSEKQVKEGRLSSAYKIGLLYAEGNQGWPKNAKEAAKWLQISAASADKWDLRMARGKSQSRLGRMYLHGEGVPQSDIEAAFWLALQVQESHFYTKEILLCKNPDFPHNDVKEDRELCESVLKKLTPEQAQEVKERVEKARDAYCVRLPTDCISK